jgi:hypothetical protein
MFEKPLSVINGVGHIDKPIWKVSDVSLVGGFTPFEKY